MGLNRDIYEVVKRIPYGQVSSYGRIARMVGCSARQVGYAMAAAPDGFDIPWHRVINSKGEISERKEGAGDDRQRQKLIEEGIVFDPKGRISFEQFGCPDLALMVPAGDLPEDWPADWPDPLEWEKHRP